ncbi:glycosyltransferase family 2 protein [Chitinibacter tainanensis]|uniref:glycosyltransferase family 2 protein n=1 Tax=Chitinibacter tainanensis TaxID=230667 RepID=UPI0005582E8E|nr:glycosyltransferase [Chitinibacter tainanensis]
MKPIVTIICVSRNNARFLKQFAESIAKQTFQDWKVLFIDDSSEDESVEVVRKALPADRLQIIESESRLGYPALMEMAWNMADTELVCFLDGDDYWASEHSLRYMVEGCEGHDAFFGSAIFYMQSAGCYLPCSSRCWGFSDPFPYMFRTGDSPFTLSAIFRKSVMPKCSPFVRRFSAADYSLFLEFALHARNVAYSKQVIGVYRRHDTNITLTTHTGARFLHRAEECRSGLIETYGRDFIFNQIKHRQGDFL